MIMLKHKIQNILFVEDNMVDFNVVLKQIQTRWKSFLEPNFTYTHVKSITAAQKAIRKETFDVLLFDGNIRNKVSTVLFPLVKRKGCIDKTIMVPGSPDEWTKPCSEFNIPIFHKLAIPTADSVFALA